MHRFGLFRSRSTRRSSKFLRTEQKSDPEDPEDPPFGPAEDQSCFPLDGETISYGETLTYSVILVSWKCRRGSARQEEESKLLSSPWSVNTHWFGFSRETMRRRDTVPLPKSGFGGWRPWLRGVLSWSWAHNNRISSPHAIGGIFWSAPCLGRSLLL